MVELKERSPWNALTPVGRGAGVIGMPVTDRAVATVMVRRDMTAALVERASESFGIVLLDQPRRSAANGLAFLGIGPGKWLAMADRPASGFLAELVARLEPLAAVVDQSGALAMMRLSGPALSATLEKGFLVDVRGFAIGDCAVTSVHHIGATICRVTEDSFEIAVARSLAGSLLHWLTASAGADGLVFAST